MRNLMVGCALLAGALLVVAHEPSLRVNAQDKPAGQKQPAPPAPQSGAPAAHKVDAAKEAQIRDLMEVTGAKNLGEQLMKAGMEQFRESVNESQPNNPRANQFVDAFVIRFQNHFDPNALTEQVIPIYDKYLSDEDLKGLLEYYRSPIGQRMLKVLPEVARESQVAGFNMGQKAAQQAMDDLKKDYPEFVNNDKEEGKGSTPEKKNE